MERVKKQIEELRTKHRKVTLLLGETIYRLYKLRNIRFLYTSDGVEDEREVRKILNLLDYIVDRIEKFEEIHLEAELSKGVKRQGEPEGIEENETEKAGAGRDHGRVEEKRFAGKCT